MDEPIIASTPDEIREWSIHCLAEGLHRPGEEGVARLIFMEDGVIHKIMIFPGISWAMDATHNGVRRVHYFTKPEFRRRGYAGRLYKLMNSL